jgi:hypothetical protein
MFPTANSIIYRNEDGEVLGWDNPSYDEPPEPDEDGNVWPDDEEDD